jgi:hypothetical protein
MKVDAWTIHPRLIPGIPGSCHAANCFIAEGPSDKPQNQPENASSIPQIRAGPYHRFIEMGYHGNTFI